MSPCSGETAPCSLHCFKEEGQIRLICESCTDSPFSLGEPNGTPWSQETLALFQQDRPVLRRHEGEDATRVNEVEGAVREIKRSGDIHDAERYVCQPAYMSVRTGITDHPLAQIDANDLHAGKCIGHVMHPATRAARQVEYSCDV